MKTLPIRFTGGLDRSASMANSGLSTASYLKGWKPNPLNPKELVTCRGFGVGTFALNIGQINVDSAFTNFPPVSGNKPVPFSNLTVVALLTDGTAITEECVWAFGGQQAPVLYQFSTNPTSLWGQFFLVINDVANMKTVLPLGGRLQIAIASPTTFTWQIDAGAVSAPLPCSVTGTTFGPFTLYFMTDKGFTVGPMGYYQRTDRSNDSIYFTSPPNPSGKLALTWTVLGSDYFYVASSGRIVKVTRDLGGITYAISAGYSPISGVDVETFYGHVIVVAASYGSPTTSKKIQWSDNIEPNTFFATDTNEADSYTIPASAAVSPRKALAWKDTLFIFTSGKSYYTNYIGLPNVFSFGPFVDVNVGGYLVQNVSQIRYAGNQSLARGSPAGVYVLSSNQVLLFNGASFTDISQPLIGVNTLLEQIFYSPLLKELYLLTVDHRMFVYQEITSTWHEEYALYGAGPSGVGWPVFFADFSNPSSGKLTVEIGAGDSRTYNRFGMRDAPASVVVGGPPTLRTQILSGGLFGLVKEAMGGYYVGTLPKQTKVVTVNWYVCDDGQIDLATIATNPAATLVATSRDGTLSFPRVPFRGLVLEVVLSDTTGGRFPGVSIDDPQEIRLIGLELEVTGTWPQQSAGNEPSR